MGVVFSLRWNDADIFYDAFLQEEVEGDASGNEHGEQDSSVHGEAYQGAKAMVGIGWDTEGSILGPLLFHG